MIVPRVNVAIEISDAATGSILHREEQHNLVTLVGRNLLRDLLHWAGAPDDPRRRGLSHMALGTGTAAPAAANISLQTEVFRDVFTQRVRTDARTVYRFFLGSLAANGHTLTEAGLFGDGATTAVLGSGSLYARVTFAPLVKTTAIAVTFVWTLTWEVA